MAARTADGGAPALVLSEEAWELAGREFGPLPSASCISYVQDVGDLVLLFDTENAVALGVEEATLAFSAPAWATTMRCTD